MQFIVKLLIAVVLQCVVFSVALAAEEADFSVYIFKEGKPVSTAKLLLDGQKFADFNKNGAVYGKVSAGAHQVSIQTISNKSFDFDINVIAGENLQALVTMYADGTKPLLEIESSAAGAAGATAVVANQAQSDGHGFISATVTSIETNKPIKDVQVFISGVNVKLNTDAKGQFRREVPVGNYSVSLLHSGFNTRTKENIVIEKDQTAALEFSMTPAGVELPEHVVLEPFLSGTLASAIGEQKDSTSVGNVLGAEQISRSGDSDVAGALRRVSGVTLVNGKFIFVRGLGERYSSTLINTAPMPSPDPTRRVVPLDLFPTSFLDSIMIQKTYSVDRPGEFAGGTVDMRTRTIPDEFLLQFSGQIGFVQGTTFDSGLRYHGGSTDFMGIDDGARALPDSIAEVVDNGGTLRRSNIFNPDGFTPEELQVFGEDLSGVWDLIPSNIGPDGRMQFSIGNSFNYKGLDLGFYSSVRWSQQWDTQQETRRTTKTNAGNELSIRDDFTFFGTEREVQLDAYVAIEAAYQEDHRFFANAFILRQTTDQARLQEGSTSGETNNIRRYLLEYIENQLYTYQVGGEHNLHLFEDNKFLDDVKLKWLYTDGRASRDAPKERRYRYDEQEDGTYEFSSRADSNQTIYSNLNDRDENARLDVSLPVHINQDFDLIVNTGFLSQRKNRDSDIRRFGYNQVGPDARDPEVLSQPFLEQILTEPYISPNGFEIREITQSTDTYTAEQNLLAYYSQLDLSMFDMFRLSGGLRWEDNEQNVTTFELFNPDNDPIETSVERVDMLPAFNGTWFISEKQQLRIGYSQTLSRPDFRELSPAPFTDPVTDKITFGNPDLDQTEITNYDARWEYYFSNSENVSLSFFWKDLKNPIERIQVAGTGALLTFQNAENANVFGFEFELLKNLDFIWSGLENFYFSGNYTWSESNVTLTEENLQAQTTNDRPLQGHSPHVINVQLGYDNPAWGTTATLLYNTTAERIVEVGVVGLPDSYQQGFNQLDFVYNQRINDWFAINFRMKNLLDDTVEVLQGDIVTRSYTPGREFKIGIRLNY